MIIYNKIPSELQNLIGKVFIQAENIRTLIILISFSFLFILFSIIQKQNNQKHIKLYNTIINYLHNFIVKNNFSLFLIFLFFVSMFINYIYLINISLFSQLHLVIILISFIGIILSKSKISKHEVSYAQKAIYNFLILIILFSPILSFINYSFSLFYIPNKQLIINIGTENDENPTKKIYLTENKGNIQKNKHKLLELGSKNNIHTIKYNFRYYNNKPAILTIAEKNKIPDKELFLNIKMQSNAPVYLTDIDDNKKLIYDALPANFEKMDVKFADKNIYYNKNLIDHSKSKIKNNNSRNEKDQLFSVIPEGSTINISHLSKYKQTEFRSMTLRDVNLMDNDQNITNISTSIILRENNIYTVLDNALKLELEVKNLDIKNQNKYEKINLMIMDSKGEIIESKTFNSTEIKEKILKWDIPILEKDIYKIIITANEDSRILLKKININTNKFVMDGNIEYYKTIDIFYAKNTKDKKSIIETKKIITNKDGIYKNSIPISLSRETWFNPYFYIFSDDSDQIEYFITETKKSFSSQYPWIMLNINLQAKAYRNKKNDLIFTLQAMDDEKKGVLLLDEIKLNY